MKGYAIYDNIARTEAFSGRAITKKIFMNSQEPLIVYPFLQDAQDLAEFITEDQRGMTTVFLVDYVYFPKEVKPPHKFEYASEIVFLCPLITYDSTEAYIYHDNGYYRAETKNPYKINDKSIIKLMED